MTDIPKYAIVWCNKVGDDYEIPNILYTDDWPIDDISNTNWVYFDMHNSMREPFLRMLRERRLNPEASLRYAAGRRWNYADPGKILT